jgi:hypothetical protein
MAIKGFQTPTAQALQKGGQACDKGVRPNGRLRPFKPDPPCVSPAQGHERPTDEASPCVIAPTPTRTIGVSNARMHGVGRAPSSHTLCSCRCSPNQGSKGSAYANIGARRRPALSYRSR